MAAALTAQMGNLNLTQPMQRPGFGTKGKKHMVRVNCFQIQAPSTMAYHYDVKIIPDKKPQKVYRQVWQELCDKLRVFDGLAVVFDGKANAYSPRPLSAEEGSFEVVLPESDGSISNSPGNRFTVKMRLARPIDLSSLAMFASGSRQGSQLDEGAVMTCLQALNIAIQHTAFQQNPNRGPAFFPPPAATMVNSRQISKAIEIWSGFYTSLRPGISKIFINLDLSSGMMVMQGNLPDVIVSFARSANPRFGFNDIGVGMPGRLAVELNRFLKRVRVTSGLKGPDGRPLKRKIEELSPKTPLTATFEYEGKTINVATYFDRVYGYRVKNPNWPCVRVSKVALWPLEVASVDAGQLWNRKLDPRQTSDSLKLTTLAPPVRVPALKKGIESINITNKGSVLDQWGYKISQTPLEVEARLLPPPELNFASGRKASPRDGTWNLQNQKFFKTPQAPIQRWLVFIFDHPNLFTKQMARPLLDGFVAGCQAVGVQLDPARADMVHHVHPNDAKSPDMLFNYMKKCSAQAPDLIVCFLSSKPCPEYAVIKYVGDVATGIPTQCMAIPIVKKKAGPQYWANLALKVNAKLGGINSCLPPSHLLGFHDAKVPAMIMGADVSHPGPASNQPSVAALVGTMDSAASIYTTSIDVQLSRMEVIANIGEMFTKLIKRFETQNKVKPQKIIFFRDGCSEGQFPIVLARELSEMRSAARLMDPNYAPRITYIVCGKRHHISIFPIAPQDQDRTGNAKAGPPQTTIDTAIVSPFQFDWYLQSHASLLGTSRSAHYTVLADDSHLTADVLQQVVYNLCYTYARCTRSVSYATPAYYADLVCGRASTLLHLQDEDTSSTMGSGSETDRERARLLAATRSRLRDIHVAHTTRAYWM